MLNLRNICSYFTNTMMNIIVGFLLVSHTGTSLAFDPCTYGGKKPRKEQYWEFAIDVTCRDGKPAVFSAYDVEGHELWRAELKDEKFHGKAVIQVCQKGLCRKSAEVTYEKGMLNGPALLFRADGTKATVFYKNGVLDGSFSVKRGRDEVRGRFADGVLTSSEPEGSFRSDDLVIDFGRLDGIYREVLDYRYFADKASDMTVNVFGFLHVRKRKEESTVYSFGLRQRFSMINGIGLDYENGQVKEQVRYKRGSEVARRSILPGSEWKETPKFEFPKTYDMVLTLGLGYGTSGRFNADIAFIPMHTKDIGGGGIGVIAGIYNADKPYYNAGVAVGAIAFFFTGYVAAGARFDDEVAYPDVVVGAGLAGLMLYLRAASPQTTLGKPLELGITAKIPLLGIL
jgi:hypothetical protein